MEIGCNDGRCLTGISNSPAYISLPLSCLVESSETERNTQTSWSFLIVWWQASIGIHFLTRSLHSTWKWVSQKNNACSFFVWKLWYHRPILEIKYFTRGLHDLRKLVFCNSNSMTESAQRANSVKINIMIFNKTVENIKTLFKLGSFKLKWFI